MKTQKYGVEIELTGIKRADAAQVVADYYGTSKEYLGTYYEKWGARDRQGRLWVMMSDSSIRTELKNGTSVGSEYSCEMVTPILGWEDIEDLQEIVRMLRSKGAIANSSCGIHVHVDATGFTAKKIKNLVNIMACKEDLLYKALQVRPNRESSYCRKTDETFFRKINNKQHLTVNRIADYWYEGQRDGDTRLNHYNSTRYHALNLHSLWQRKGIEFRCFNGTTHAGKIKTYIQLCLAICNQALTQDKARAMKTKSNNEKYTFRTWLLRMGMIGDEFKTARDFLLKNLDGDIAFKNGRPNRAA